MGRINFKDEYLGRGKNLMVENGKKKNKKKKMGTCTLKEAKAAEITK